MITTDATIRQQAMFDAYCYWEDERHVKKVDGLIEIQRRLFIGQEVGNVKLASDLMRMIPQLIENKLNHDNLIEIDVCYAETARMFKHFARRTSGRMSKIEKPLYETWLDFGLHPQIKTTRSRAWAFIKLASLVAMKNVK